EAIERLARAAQRGDAARRDGVPAARQLAPRRRALRQLPPEQPFALEPVERRVQRAARDAAAGLLLELTRDLDAVGAGAEAQDDEQELLFEFAQIGGRHRRLVYRLSL